ncbi:hypothetical protein FB451DRAFT_1394072 [Mycena latifolia]|nr:hypothetical protein FB451DRAFT_1394072 [Mycena latifolia]
MGTLVADPFKDHLLAVLSLHDAPKTAPLPQYQGPHDWQTDAILRAVDALRVMARRQPEAHPLPQTPPATMLTRNGTVTRRAGPPGRRRRGVRPGRPTRTAWRATRPRRWGRAMRAAIGPRTSIMRRAPAWSRRGPGGGRAGERGEPGGLGCARGAEAVGGIQVFIGHRIYGDFTLLSPENEEVFAYTRSYKNWRALVLLNFTARNVSFALPANAEWFKHRLIKGILLMVLPWRWN